MKYPRMLETHPLACKENQILGDHYRFTVLTESLVRMEYSPSGHFEDRATQVVLNRNFPAVSFDTAESEEELLIVTQKLRLSYQKNRPFTPHTLSVRLPGQYGSWRFGETDGNLKGTARTLDEVNGACELENGSFRCAAAPRWTTARAWYSPTTVLSPLAPTKNRTSTFSGMAHPSTKD